MLPPLTAACNYFATVTCASQANVALQAAKDVMTTFGKILETHGPLEYAIWHIQSHEENQTYSEYITRVTCHQIAHMKFIAPDVRWTLVPF